jgi:nucleoside-diphosphate-sugar epimerase
MNKSTHPTILITGASGFVGTELTQYFVAKKWHVIALVRNANRYPKTDHISYAEYDLTKPFDDTIFKGADYLVHTAFIKYDRQHPDALEANVEGANRLIAAARKHKLKKTVFMSSMSAHDEAVSVYGKQKLAVEKVFSGPNDVNLRSGLILGNGGIVKQMVGFIKSKRVVPLIDGGTQPLQVIGVYDLARVIDAALTNSTLQGVFTVANPRVYRYKDFYAAIGTQLGIKLFYVPVPFIVLLAAMRTIAFLHLPLSVNEDNLWGLKMLRAVDNAQDLQTLGISLDDLQTVLAKPGIIAPHAK